MGGVWKLGEAESPPPGNLERKKRLLQGEVGPLRSLPASVHTAVIEAPSSLPRGPPKPSLFLNNLESSQLCIQGPASSSPTRPSKRMD